MSFRIQLIALLALSTVIAASSALAAGGDTQPFKVSSTLDDTTVLPHRIRWLARPKLPPSQVSKVEFLDLGRHLDAPALTAPRAQGRP